MDLDAQRRAARIFQSLASLPPTRRSQALEQACQGDHRLEAMVRSMLALEDELPEDANPLLSGPQEAPSRPVILQTGQAVGRYEVMHCLGIGGMAEVWCVRHQSLNTRHALKVLTRAGPTLQRRLLNEGRVQSRLLHDNILPVRDVIDISGTPALLMPLVEGPSLERLLSHYTPTRCEALHLFSAILSGVAFAHDAGVIHRDIKPGNILLATRQDAVVPLIADFGLVKELNASSLTATGAMMGTPAYAAPEQLIDASTTDPRADLYALGVLLFELLTGRLPRPDTLDAFAILQPDTVDFTGVPDDLAALIGDLIQPAPAQRPPDCAAVAARLPAHGSDLDGLHAALSAATPAPPPQDTLDLLPPSNLPRIPDRFLGRRRELSALQAWLTSPTASRLLTVTGVGGCGKTRLCLELGHTVEGAWAGGVWWVDLSESRSLTELLAAIGRVLEPRQPRLSVSRIAEMLTERGQCLVFLDNFEQISHLATQTIGAWLDAVPDVTFVVTSRRPLRLSGEQLHAVEPLLEEDGMALLRDRVDGAAGWEAADPALLQRLVALLDGLPLAIELAASRARMLPPEQLLDRLTRRFDLLDSQADTLPARQRTLRAALSWSWDLLSPAEQLTLAQLSVCEGGFTIEAAEAIVDLSDLDDSDEYWIEDLLAELVDSSLLQSRLHTTTESTRLSMLVSVHAFAREQLQHTADTWLRHGAYFSDMGTDAHVRLANTRNGQQWRAAMIAETSNLVAAARRAIERADHHQAARLICGVVDATFTISAMTVAIELLHTLRRVWPAEVSRPYARLLFRCGGVAVHAGAEDDAMESYQAVLRICAALGPSTRLLHARAHNQLSDFYRRLRRIDEAESHSAAALALLPARPTVPYEQYVRGNVVMRQGNLLKMRRRPEEALALYEEAEVLFARLGALSSLSSVQQSTGHVLVQLGRKREARRFYERALKIDRARGATLFEINGLISLVALDLEKPDALDLIRQADQMARRLGVARMQLVVWRFLGRLHTNHGDLGAATACYDEALALAADHGQRGYHAEVIGDRAILERLRTPPDAATATITGWLDGLSGHHRTPAGELHLQLGILALERGDLPAALHHLAEAEEHISKPHHRAWARVCRHEALVLAGQPQAAADCAARLDETLRSDDGVRLSLHLLRHLSAARIALHRGDSAGARRELAAADARAAASAAIPVTDCHRQRTALMQRLSVGDEARV